MSAPDRRQFRPLIFPKFYYVDADPKQESPAIDYKAAYELQRITSKKLALLGIKLIESMEKAATGKVKEDFSAAKQDLTNILLEA